jgi:adiponectin receptor
MESTEIEEVPKEESLMSLSSSSSSSLISKFQGDMVQMFNEQKAYLRRHQTSLTNAGERVMDNLSVFADNVQVFADETSGKVIKKVGIIAQTIRYRLVHFEELPAFMRDNDYIHTKYRQVSGYAECWKSIFKVHNETVNIWTHLLGALLFLYLNIRTYFTFPREAEAGDYIIFTWFFICAIKCLTCSTIFHVCHCHSQKAHNRFCCLDHMGINALICGSFCITTYYGHYCHSGWRNFYLTLTLLLSSIGWSGSLVPKWHQYEFRILRTVFYVSLGFILAAPILHYLVEHGIPKQLDTWGLYGYPMMVFLYLSGALIYAARIPER